MARLLLLLTIASLLLPVSADAHGHRHRTHRPHASTTTRRQSASPAHRQSASPAHRQSVATARRQRATAHLQTVRRITLGELASRDPAALATSVAERYWGAVPCGGQIAVQADRPLAPGLDPTTDGWATFNSSLGPNNLAAPPTTYTQCTISLAHWQWPTSSAMASDWNMFCLTVIHEMGHLLGHPHSTIPGSVMAPVFTDEANVPSICRASRPSGG